ncbi:MAG: GNAT family N-acetyltransferase [Lentisphaerae bacterium]|jgi:ribosomal protein S18 acetylase RimI-like enzyme|nr:GNAT family N-acetyltransferase [Lentisphaerota bacterium]
MIRAFCDSDREVIVDIANRAWMPIRRMTRQALGDKVADLLVGAAGDSRSKGEEIRRQIENAPENILVCEEDGKVVGFITFMIDDQKKIGTIGNNAADPDCGLKGIGQQMYRAVLELFRSRGMQAARVFTGLDDAHARARRAYERAGFNRQLTHVTYYMEL